MFNKFFNQENPYIKVMNRVFDLAVLNILWLVFSLPVLTIGCATTAAAAVCFRMIRDEYTSVLAGFWKSFKANFKQATQVWLLTLALTALFGLDLWYFWWGQGFLTGIPQLIVCGVFVFLLLNTVLTATYSIAMTALFENTLRMTLHNAILFALHNPMRDIIILAVLAVMAGIIIFAPIIIPPLAIIVIFLGFSFTIFLNCRILLPIFKPYLVEGENEDAI